jgi:hypothetical protein
MDPSALVQISDDHFELFDDPRPDLARQMAAEVPAFEIFYGDGEGSEPLEP